MSETLAVAARLACEEPNPWLPDVFAAVYDLLSHKGMALQERLFFEGDAGAAARGKFRSEFLDPLQSRQAVQLGGLSADFQGYLRLQMRNYRSDLYNSQVTRNLLMCLDTMDWLFWGLAVGEGGLDQHAYLSGYRAELLANRSLVRLPSGGHLLPRAASAARPARSVADFFGHVVRVKEPTDCELSYRFLAGLWRAKREVVQKIGVIPTILRADELAWKVSGDRYSVHAKLDVRDRVIAALDWLGAAEVDLILMPELVASDDLVKRVQAWRRARPEAHPRLILAGSYMDVDVGDVEWRNRAFVIGPTGKIEWTQDKMNPYTFSAKHQTDSGLPLCDPVIDLIEAIQVAPQRLQVRDSPHGERFAVLICEDFARSRPHHDLAVEIGLNRILVPVMNGAREQPNDWIHRYAINFAQEPAATSIIVNSGTLVTRKTPHIDDYVAVFDRTRKPIVGHRFELDPTGGISAILLEVTIGRD